MNRLIDHHPFLTILAFVALVAVGPWLAIWLSRNDNGEDDSP